MTACELPGSDHNSVGEGSDRRGSSIGSAGQIPGQRQRIARRGYRINSEREGTRYRPGRGGVDRGASSDRLRIGTGPEAGAMIEETQARDVQRPAVGNGKGGDEIQQAGLLNTSGEDRLPVP